MQNKHARHLSDSHENDDLDIEMQDMHSIASLSTAPTSKKHHNKDYAELSKNQSLGGNNRQFHDYVNANDDTLDEDTMVEETKEEEEEDVETLDSDRLEEIAPEQHSHKKAKNKKITHKASNAVR